MGRSGWEAEGAPQSLGAANGAPGGSRKPLPQGSFLGKWLQKLQAICVDKEAIVDLMRLVGALALFSAQIATKVFLRVYFSRFSPLYFSSVQTWDSSRYQKRPRDSTPRHHPPTQGFRLGYPARASILHLRYGGANPFTSWEIFCGNGGRGALQKEKNNPARGINLSECRDRTVCTQRRYN